MLTNFDKAWLPLVLAVVGVAVYQGFITKEQGSALTNSVGPAVIAAIQAVLVYLVPNKGGGS